MKIYAPHHLPKFYIYESIIDLNAQPSWREHFPNGGGMNNYVHVVCRNSNTNNQQPTEPDILLYKLFHNAEGNQKDFNFGNLLTQLDKKYDLWSLLFLCSTYLPTDGSLNVRAILNEYVTGQNPNPAKQILHCSYGKLVYHFQLEQLYKVFTGSGDLENAINFRRYFNKKLHAITIPILREQLPNGPTFKEFVEHHHISDFVYKPQWEAAGKLIELLQFLGKM